MRRTDDESLWPWPLTLKLVRNVTRVTECLPANFGDRLLRLFVSDLWAIGRSRVDHLSICEARRGVIAIDRSASSKLLLLRSPKSTNNRITVFRQQNSRFRKRFSKIGLSYNVAVPLSLEYYVWVWCKLIQKWPSNTLNNNNNQRYAVSSDWKICRRMCVSINGPGDLDLWSFNQSISLIGPWNWYASRIKDGEPSFRI